MVYLQRFELVLDFQLTQACVLLNNLIVVVDHTTSTRVATTKVVSCCVALMNVTDTCITPHALIVNKSGAIGMRPTLPRLEVRPGLQLLCQRLLHFECVNQEWPLPPNQCLVNFFGRESLCEDIFPHFSEPRMGGEGIDRTHTRHCLFKCMSTAFIFSNEVLIFRERAMEIGGAWRC